MTGTRDAPTGSVLVAPTDGFRHCQPFRCNLVGEEENGRTAQGCWWGGGQMARGSRTSAKELPEYRYSSATKHGRLAHRTAADHQMASIINDLILAISRRHIFCLVIPTLLYQRCALFLSTIILYLHSTLDQALKNVVQLKLNPKTRLFLSTESNTIGSSLILSTSNNFGLTQLYVHRKFI